MNDGNIDNNTLNSNTPYKAVGNLNTVIGNPNINVNSVTTSNILEDNNMQNNSVPVDVLGNSNDGINSITANVNNINTGDDISNYINSINQPLNNNLSDTTNNSNNNQDTTVNSSDLTVNAVNSNQTNSNNVVYENAYQSKIGKKVSKKIVIPSEFKTAIVIVVILLIVLAFFEPIYNFFKDLFLFG